jgi:hypothetical protein
MHDEKSSGYRIAAHLAQAPAKLTAKLSRRLQIAEYDWLVD